MNDEIRVPMTLPLDSDGFLRRECPSCEQQFKWFNHEDGDANAEVVNQYFCPLCGVASGVDSWWTPEQIDYMEGIGGPVIEQFLQDSIDDMFEGVKGLTFKSDQSFTLDSETPHALVESDDMTIVEPPCHPNEPFKVGETVASAYCIICGEAFGI